jgi:small-conductance mechanosensitive channel
MIGEQAIFLSGIMTGKYLFAFVFFLFSLGILIFLNKFGFLVRIINGFAKHTRNNFDDFLFMTFQKIGWPFYFFISLFIGSRFVELSPSFDKYFSIFTSLVICYYLLKVIGAIVDFWINNYKAVHKGEDDYAGLLKLCRKIISFIVWVAIILFILDRTGVNISAILTGFGITSIVIAFALQNILMDIFSYLLIYFDRPFVIGDFIETVDISGTVKKISIRSTRIDSINGEELIISNRKIMDSIIHNFKKSVKKRKNIIIKISNKTSSKAMGKFLEQMKKMLKKQEKVEYDRVNFSDIGDKALVFEIVYFVNVKGYNEYMEIQERINFKIKEIIEKNRIKLA